jgi:hypothetical protein
MTESEKKIRELEKKLNTNDIKVISDAIILLRNEDPFKGAIRLLAVLFDTTNDLTIKNLISNFMNDIKNPGATIEVVTEVMENYKPETTCMLASSCWQSGLDYSEFAVDFANVFIRGDYATALECFTVIEESVLRNPGMDKSEIIRLLENNKNPSSAEKTTLTLALISVLK